MQAQFIVKELVNRGKCLVLLAQNEFETGQATVANGQPREFKATVREEDGSYIIKVPMGKLKDYPIGDRVLVQTEF